MIEFQNISKNYLLKKDRFRSLSNQFNEWLKLKDLGSRPEPELFHALSNINFKITEGESVGILGANGAGKTTILKLIANITKPTNGSIALSGRIAPLIEVGAGFHPELTGRENVLLNGVILGMGRKEILKAFDAIVAFSELEQFIDVPVKQYSSGMFVRLGFSIAMHSNFDVLLADEILAVGDARFQIKCFNKFREIRNQKKTLVFISHSTDLLKQHCARGLVLNQGRLICDGSIDSAVNQYQALSQ